VSVNPSQPLSSAESVYRIGGLALSLARAEREHETKRYTLSFRSLQRQSDPLCHRIDDVAFVQLLGHTLTHRDTKQLVDLCMYISEEHALTNEIDVLHRLHTSLSSLRRGRLRDQLLGILEKALIECSLSKQQEASNSLACVRIRSKCQQSSRGGTASECALSVIPVDVQASPT